MASICLAGLDGPISFMYHDANRTDCRSFLWYTVYNNVHIRSAQFQCDFSHISREDDNVTVVQIIVWVHLAVCRNNGQLNTAQIKLLVQGCLCAPCTINIIIIIERPINSFD